MAVKVYTTTWCGDCYRTKRFLQSQGVAFEEIDIDQNEQAAQVVMQQNQGKRRVPTLEINGAFYGNPPLHELAELFSNP
jgi:mycoredoxin